MMWSISALLRSTAAARAPVRVRARATVLRSGAGAGPGAGVDTVAPAGARAGSSNLSIKTFRTYERSVGNPPHMNELPLPCLPWGPYYKERQQFYNKCFAIGALWFLFSSYTMYATGSIWLNWAPPRIPADPPQLFSSCDPWVDTSFDPPQ